MTDEAMDLRRCRRARAASGVSRGVPGPAGRGVAAVVLIALLAVLPAREVRAARNCGPAPGPAVIEVITAEPEVSVNDRLSQAELAGLSAREYGHVHAAGVAVFGLTAGRVKSELFVESLIEKHGSGLFCGWPSRLVARVAYDGPIAVYVAREYPRGSCPFDAILAHEMKHVAVFRTAVQGYERRITAALRQALDRALLPVTGQDAELVKRRVKQQFEGAFRRAVAEATAERNRVNAALDTPESYQRTRARCRAW